VKRVPLWMTLSALFASSFFIVANFTDVFLGLNVISGCIQVVLNVFVFISWRRGYLIATGFGKIVALIGTIFPPIMATITIVRVLVPAVISLI